MLTRQWFKQCFPILALLFVFISYLPCLKADFVNWDDDVHLLNNFTAHSSQGLDLTGIWTTTVNNTYIPLTVSSWAIEHYFFGFNPFVFHLDNVLLHLMVTALVIIFGQRMGLSPIAAALAALLFGIHPIHVESVAWVTERKDVLYAMIYMLALLTYLQYIDKGRKKYFWLTILLGVLSICAKPMAASLPFMLLVLDWFRGRRWTLQIIVEKILCGLFLVPIAFITYSANSVLVQPQTGQGLFVWIWCFMFYLYKFLVPLPSHLFYVLPRSEYIFYLTTALFPVLLATLWVFRRNRWFILAFAFYFVNIFFLLRFHPFLCLISDRYMYLPSIGLCMFLAVLVEKAFFLFQSRRLYISSLSVALCAFTVLLAATTWGQCEIWQSSVTLWNHQLKYGPKEASWLAYCKLADAYAAKSNHLALDDHQFSRIYMLYSKAIELKPDYLNSYLGMGNLFGSAGDGDNAEKYYQQVLLIDSNNFDALYNLGRIYQKKNLPQQAINYFYRAKAAKPFLLHEEGF